MAEREARIAAQRTAPDATRETTTDVDEVVIVDETTQES